MYPADIVIGGDGGDAIVILVIVILALVAGLLLIKLANRV